MTSKGVPRFVKVIVSVVVVGIVLALVFGWQISKMREAEERHDCQRSVAFRDDTRAMWLWLGRQFPEGATEVGLQQQLDRLVPELECVDGNPTPVVPNE